ncbi:MAG: 2-amino-4-hydroxy-6-hydroxymethyldihydropteridine diphosphokinase [Chlamydiales bacterium]|nr:2-amino-4-hydroxy-6-hydroxymethyldihydropteridine diphosphokinase [Chlamydiales bacterium]
METGTEVFLGFGGNIGDTKAVLTQAIDLIRELPLVYNVMSSQFYLTSPVSDIPQAPYINAVCRLETSYSPTELLGCLQDLEGLFGKDMMPKVKNAPRVLDIDILFFGQQRIVAPGLEIPHPRWQERLFVLRPLSDLERHITLPTGQIVDVNYLIDTFPHLANQWVTPVPEEKANCPEMKFNKVVG